MSILSTTIKGARFARAGGVSVRRKRLPGNAANVTRAFASTSFGSNLSYCPRPREQHNGDRQVAVAPHHLDCRPG